MAALPCLPRMKPSPPTRIGAFDLPVEDDLRPSRFTPYDGAPLESQFSATIVHRRTTAERPCQAWRTSRYGTASCGEDCCGDRGPATSGL